MAKGQTGTTNPRGGQHDQRYFTGAPGAPPSEPGPNAEMIAEALRNAYAAGLKAQAAYDIPILQKYHGKVELLKAALCAQIGAGALAARGLQE